MAAWFGEELFETSKMQSFSDRKCLSGSTLTCPVCEERMLIQIWLRISKGSLVRIFDGAGTGASMIL